MPTELEFSYLAGLIDGEGCFSIRKSRNIMSAELTIGMTDEPIVEWLVQTFGGSHSVSSAPRSNNGRRDMHYWRPQAKLLRVLLPQILPYLRVKQEHAKLFTEWYVLIDNTVYGANHKAPPEVTARKEAIRAAVSSMNYTKTGKQIHPS